MSDRKYGYNHSITNSDIKNTNNHINNKEIQQEVNELEECNKHIMGINNEFEGNFLD